MVLEDDEDDFRRASVDSGSGTKRGKTEVGETKRKRRRKRIMDSGMLTISHSWCIQSAHNSVYTLAANRPFNFHAFERPSARFICVWGFEVGGTGIVARFLCYCLC